MKKKKEITWDDIKAMNAETTKILKEISRMVREEKKERKEENRKRIEEKKEEKKRLQEERQRREEERKEEKQRREEEKKEEKKRMEEEKRKREEERLKREKEREEERNEEKKRMDHLDKLFAQTREQIGGISRSNGEFCEEYFINSFKENPTFLGEKYDRVLENHRPDPAEIDDEYDLVLRNGTTIVLIEMKYKAGTDDVGKMFSKLHTYRANYPIFKDYKIYLALASFRFPKVVRARAEKEGVVLIQQRGEKIEIISENIRYW